MRIAVYGLGYVGCVSAASFARLGHEVAGVDSNPAKVAMIEAGEAPVLEPGLPELVAEQVMAGRLQATADGEAAMERADIALLCVGTPSRANGSTATDALERVAETVGRGLARRGGGNRATVVVRAECVRLSERRPDDHDANVIPARIDSIRYGGAVWHCTLHIAGQAAWSASSPNDGAAGKVFAPGTDSRVLANG